MDHISHLFRGSSNTTETYLQMGRDAAEKYVNGQGVLNEIIGGMVKSAGLTRKQAELVCQVANNAAFGQLFKEAEGNPEFPLAEPDVVWQSTQKRSPLDQLAGGGAGQVKTAEALLDLDAPQRNHLEWVRGSKGVVEIEKFLFGEHHFTKTSSGLPDNSKTAVALKLKQKVAGTALHAESEAVSAKHMAKAAATQFVRAASQYLVTDGGSYPDLERALLTAVTEDEGFVKRAVAEVRGHMESLHPHMTLEPGQLEEPTGSSDVDESSPIIVHAKDLYKQAQVYEEAKARAEDSRVGEQKLDGFIRERLTA